ncbi:hypothetical protein BpHYR1_026192 [Brachionus plicatilis]|uniref:Uncharacterized protein n=1 Tax=Brachionus plicatilis TaxID=10195 RepID=A0A3M7RS32_BRAPC|nr:hypothetical protein BpHYR1_026192 [Brachionus plicatilis]
MMLKNSMRNLFERYKRYLFFTGHLIFKDGICDQKLITYIFMSKMLDAVRSNRSISRTVFCDNLAGQRNSQNFGPPNRPAKNIKALTVFLAVQNLTVKLTG